MQNASDKKTREAAAEGKMKPIPREPRVAPQQNAEVQPLRRAARKQEGTDESRNR